MSATRADRAATLTLPDAESMPWRTRLGIRLLYLSMYESGADVPSEMRAWLGECVSVMGRDVDGSHMRELTEQLVAEGGIVHGEDGVCGCSDSLAWEREYRRMRNVVAARDRECCAGYSARNARSAQRRD